MRMATNQKRTLPVTIAADFLGYSIAGLFKRFVRETGSKYSYTTFHGVTSRRIKNEGIEGWLIKEGFEKELKKAQAIQNKKTKPQLTKIKSQAARRI